MVPTVHTAVSTTEAEERAWRLRNSSTGCNWPETPESSKGWVQARGRTSLFVSTSRSVQVPFTMEMI